jgi:hypothetical protein
MYRLSHLFDFWSYGDNSGFVEFWNTEVSFRWAEIDVPPDTAHSRTTFSPCTVM